MHAHLEELIRKFFGAPEDLPEPWRGLFDQLNRFLEEERRKAEADPAGALRRVDERYRQMVENAPLGIAIHQDGVIRYVNPYALRLSGAASPEELIGRNVLAFTHPDFQDLTYLNFKKLEQGQAIAPHEEKIMGLAGEVLDVEVASIPFVYEGKPSIQTMFRDITDQKRVLSVLGQIVGGISQHTDYEFYPHFVESLALALNVEAVYIAATDREDRESMRVLAAWADGPRPELARIPFAGSVCEDIFRNELKVVRAGFAERYPEDPALKIQPMGDAFESFVGAPLFDRRGGPAGVVGILSCRAAFDMEMTTSILRIFAERAAAEIERMRTMDDLIENERNFRMLMDQAADGIVVADAGGVFLYVNQKLAEMLGASRDRLVGAQFGDFLTHSEARRLAVDLRELRGGQVLNLVRTVVRLDGARLHCDISVSLLSDGRIQASIRDMSERFRAEEERKSYLETLALLEEVAIELDPQFIVVRVSDSWNKLFKDQPDDDHPVGRKLDGYIHPDYQYYLTQNLSQVLNGKKQNVSIHVPAPLENGANMWLEGKFIPVRGAGGQINGLRGVLRDVTLDHLTDRQITFYAYYDNLTGLPNRIRMEENFNRALNRAEHTGKKLALGFIDLDNFDEINNYMGHRVGDLVLLYVAERLRDVLGAGENLYRWGGDKFVVLLTEFQDAEVVRETGRRLMEMCREPLEIESDLIHISYSVGFALYPDDGLTVEILMGQADRALGYAKSQGRFNFQLSQDVPSRGIYREQLSIRNALASAISKREIRAFFHPKVRAGDHRVVGLEALARWLDDSGRPRISPAMFIPVAENLGLISELGEQVLEQALEMQSELSRRSKDIRVSINVSRRQLFDPFFVDRLSRILAARNVSPDDIILEITESIAMLEVDFAIERLQELHREGYKLSIDDFGTGYSTLSQLHEMPVNELKIDMSFVRRIDTYEGLQVVQAIANMGRALNLDVVAEGVESAEAVSRLEDIGVNLLQGNYFSKPLPGDELLDFLEKR